MSVTAEFYLIVAAKISTNGWVEGKVSIRTTKAKPALGPNEVAVFVRLDLPAGLFRRPQLNATITVAEGQAPTEITTEVADNIAAVVAEHLGIRMLVRMLVQPPPAETE